MSGCKPLVQGGTSDHSDFFRESFVMFKLDLGKDVSYFLHMSKNENETNLSEQSLILGHSVLPCTMTKLVSSCPLFRDTPIQIDVSANSINAYRGVQLAWVLSPRTNI
jgi:hypothetical protein